MLREDGYEKVNRQSTTAELTDGSRNLKMAHNVVLHSATRDLWRARLVYVSCGILFWAKFGTRHIAITFSWNQNDHTKEPLEAKVIVDLRWIVIVMSKTLFRASPLHTGQH